METFVDRISAAVAQELELPAVDVRALISICNNPERGDFSLACFPLAAKLGQKGKQAAIELATRIAGIAIEEVEVEASGPFINFRINPTIVAQAVLTEVWSKEQYGSSEVGKGKTIVIDFSSPNIAKPFHLGHLRSTVIGWSLRQIFRARGYTVVGVNHLGDWGTQFGFMITAWKRWKADAEARIAAGEDQIMVFVDLYTRINTLAKEDPSVRDEARAWFKKLEDGDAEALELWRFFKDASLAEFQRVYDLLGIVHESDAGEAFYQDKMPAMVERLRESGLLVDGMTKKETAESIHQRALQKHEGALKDLAACKQKLEAPDLKDKERKKLQKKIDKTEAALPGLAKAVEETAGKIPAEDDGLRPQGVDLTDTKMGFAILIKGDGGTTYTTRDLTAVHYRCTTYQPEQILYVVGNPQRDHFVPWFEVVKKMGQDWSKGVRLEHVGFGKYLGMSTRSGTAVFLGEVLEKARVRAAEAAQAATKKVALSEEERERVARAIGTAAVKFFDLRGERTKDIDLSLAHQDEIDWDRLLDLKGDTGPYLQFAYARLAGILRRYKGQPDLGAVDFGLLGEPEAQLLIKVIGEFPAVIARAANDYEPSVVARYVIDLSQKTHSFVHHHRVIDAAAEGVDPETLRASRVFLVACAKKVIAEALDLLGIEALEQM